MNQTTGIRPHSRSRSPEVAGADLRRTHAARQAASPGSIGESIRGLAEVAWRLRAVIDEANRLRSLAMLDDCHLARLGLSRGDLPALVYGWTARMDQARPLASPLAAASALPRMKEAA